MPRYTKKLQKLKKKNISTNKKKYSQKYNLSNLAPKNQNQMEAKYCSCVQKVRNKGSVNNPYGICTSAVFGSRNSIRNRIVDCAKYYDYENMKVKKLKEIAKEKNIKGFSTMKKSKLIKILSNLK